MADAPFDGLLLLSAKDVAALRAASCRLRDMSAAALERANDAEARSRALRELFHPPTLASDPPEPPSPADAERPELVH